MNNKIESTIYNFLTPDKTPPVISSVTHSSVTKSSATITWTTDEKTTSQVIWGTNSSLSSGTTTTPTTDPDGANNTSHNIGLSGIFASTQYYYKVINTDSSGNTAESIIQTFTTAVSSDVTAPVISLISGSKDNSTSITVTWTTDENATSQVKYSTDSGLAGAITYPTSDTTADKTSHSISLTGLTACTQYYFIVISKDSANNTKESTPIQNINLSDGAAPIISSETAGSITETSATITWTTDEDATSQIKYSTASDLSGAITYPTSDTTADKTSHSISLTSLINAKAYYYKVVSADSCGISAESASIKTFITEDTQNPSMSDSNFIDRTWIFTTPYNLDFSSATDNGDITHVMLTTDGTFDTETWDTFASSYSFTHEVSDYGVVTVKVKFKDATGNESPTYEDTMGYMDGTKIVFVNDDTPTAGVAGTFADPVKTIKAALPKVTGGIDRVFVAKGTYTSFAIAGSSVFDNVYFRGGWSNDFSTVTNALSGGCYIEHDGTIGGGVTLAISVGADPIIEGFWILGYNSLGAAADSNSVPLSIDTASPIINACIIQGGVGCGSSQPQSIGIGMNISNAIIKNNLILSGNAGTDEGTYLGDSAEAGAKGIQIVNSSSPTISNNTIVTEEAHCTGTRYVSGIFIWKTLPTPKITNNIIYGRNGIGASGIRAYHGAIPTSIENNLFLNYNNLYVSAGAVFNDDDTNGIFDEIEGAGVATTVSGNRAHNVVADVFTDANNSDFTLVNASSPAANTGKNTSTTAYGSVVSDLLGITRSTVYDMGCFENF